MNEKPIARGTALQHGEDRDPLFRYAVLGLAAVEFIALAILAISKFFR